VVADIAPVKVGQAKPRTSVMKRRGTGRYENFGMSEFDLRKIELENQMERDLM